MSVRPQVAVRREVSADRKTATETQTLTKGREGKRAGREPKGNNQGPPFPDLRVTCVKALTIPKIPQQGFR